MCTHGEEKQEVGGVGSQQGVEACLRGAPQGQVQHQQQRHHQAEEAQAQTPPTRAEVLRAALAAHETGTEREIKV